MNRYAVIDLGTNTFHLLIVEALNDGSFVELYRNRFFIKLAEQGINTIGAAAFQRGLEAIHAFKDMLEKYEVNVNDVKAFGTAALRTASNGTKFIQQVFTISGIQVHIIPGSEEARLIHKGVTQAVPLHDKKALIMDIGGGSVEFIIADGTQVYWAQSFPVGVAVLHRRFHQQDPITPAEIKATEQFLAIQLKDLLKQLQKHDTPLLIGASGTFDAIESALIQQKPHPLHASLDIEAFFPFYEDLKVTTLEQRLDRDDIPNTRADMIIVALILIRFIIEKANSKTIIISAYAMKEGMLQEMIHPVS